MLSYSRTYLLLNKQVTVTAIRELTNCAFKVRNRVRRDSLEIRLRQEKQLEALTFQVNHDGASGETRTRDLPLTKGVLYQLSHTCTGARLLRPKRIKSTCNGKST